MVQQGEIFHVNGYQTIILYPLLNTACIFNEDHEKKI